MTVFEEIEVKTLGDLLDKVTPKTADPKSGRLRDCAIYRGVANKNWDMLTSLDRLGGINPAFTKIHLEHDILRNFIRYSHPYLPSSITNKWELLVVAQHHRLPTRFLDWTYSPLIAAHFATLENSRTPRVVWKLDWQLIHEHFGIKKRALLIEELEDELHKRNIESPEEFFSNTLNDRAFMTVLDPPSLDARVVAQSATLILSSEKGIALNEFLIQHGLQDTARKYIIPEDKVDQIRDQLDLCSLDERRLFPDLDGVAAEMSRYYSYSPHVDSGSSDST